jgi:zinc protease
MRRLLLILVAAGCAASHKPAAAPTPPLANQVGQPLSNAPTLPSEVAATGAAPPKPERDPWADRADLFVPPTVAPHADVKLGTVDRFRMPNGMEVIVVPRPSVPSVDVVLAVKAGSAADPLEQAGLAQFTASMLRKGTPHRTSDQIAETIDRVGGELEAAAGNDETSVGCHARARDLGLCLDLVADVTAHPTFPESEMGEIRDQLEAQVEQVKDNPQSLAAEHVANVFFGDEDSRGRPITKRSLASIDRASLIRFHRAWFAPNNSLIAISGAVDGKSVRAALRKSFGGWKQSKVAAQPARALPSATKLAVRLVDKPDSTQTTILLAGPGIAHASPDYHAVRLMNFVLGGGGFSSRLMKVVRSEGGKTYGASSSFDAGRDPGPFFVSTFTRNGETGATLQLVLNEVKKMREGGPDADELLAAKGKLIGGYGLRLETATDLAHALVSAELDGLERDSVAKYPERMAKVTTEDAARAAAAHLQPTAMVLVGQAAEIEPQLRALGIQVSDVVPYTESASPAERRAAQAPAAPASSNSSSGSDERAAGQKLLASALAAKGGVALAQVKDLALGGRGTLTMQGQALPVVVQEYQIPGHATRQEISVGPGKIVQVLANGKAFVREADQVTDLPPAAAASMKKGMWRDANFILLNAAQPGAQVREQPPVTDGGARYEVLEVIAPDGEATRILLDPVTHLIAQLVYKEDDKEVRDLVGDYRNEAGIAFPRRYGHVGADQKIEITYDRLDVNKGIAPSLFAR